MISGVGGITKKLGLMADFLRTFAAATGSTANGGLYSDRVSCSDKLRRHVRSFPAVLIHVWKQGTLGFKLCSILSTLLALCLALALLQGVETRATTLTKLADVHTGGDGMVLTRRQAPCTVQNPCSIHAIADLDQASHMGDEKKPRYKSVMLNGRFYIANGVATVDWFGTVPMEIVGKFAEEGRGMELSELVLFNDTLLSFDDRTGIVYDLVIRPGGVRGGGAPIRSFFEDLAIQELSRVPASLAEVIVDPVAKVVLTEGDGETSPKGMKIEWACEKDGELYVGSFGKEYTTTDGKEVTGTSNFWIAVLENPHKGESIHRIDWTSQYQKLRQALGCEFPGYLIHEAVNWSAYHRKWVFLPRRVSKEAYSEEADEKRGSNKMLIVDEDFESVNVVDVAYPESIPERGFSSFKFVPGSNDQMIIALRSAENAAAGSQSTFLSIFDMNGKVLFPEQQISDTIKFEGIELW
eukprot:Protomagalhaensia_sp_Gyna_25__4888@NODE_515_length_3231_cov_16_217732_g404_i0_p1_GENE_NODE_515_length_3231_cov_16_217732_g404_i0NODE_515_length_3231_cov_16_217732_g404_i0_p1_ORF_typecomplete_len467_score57_99Apyrase/PF06079_11/4_8e98_NODE_515_length_3231_cov_16_217732_g404_i04991899